MDGSAANSPTPIRIGYYDPFNIYSKIKDDLDTKFPLTNLHWKHSDSPLRSIPYLAVDLVEEIPKPSALPSSLLKINFDDHPYIRLMFIECDTLDTYRTTVRPFIREWFKNSIENQPVPIEWMLVFHVPDSVKDSTSTTFKTSVFDKLKLDFNHTANSTSTKIDRCVKVKETYISNIDKMESYNELVTKLKEKILISFNARFTVIQSELLKIDQTKGTEDFVPHDYFLMKINLAETFNDMRLYEDALGKYNEIEKELKSLNDHNHLFTSEIGFLSDLSFQNYILKDSMEASVVKEKLLSNGIGMFELKSFIFIRQAFLIQSLTDFVASISINALHVSELLGRLCHFITDMTNSLKASDRNPYKISEWSYVVLDSFLKLSFVEILDENDQPIKEVAEFKGQARLLKRSQLVTLGSLKGYYIKGLMMNLSSTLSHVPNTESNKYVITYPPLISIMESESNFENCFRELTELTIEDYTLANRPRSVDTLCTDIALLDYQHGRYEKATEILANCPSFYTQQGWSQIGSYLLGIYIDCLEKLESKDYNLLLKAYLDVFSNLSSSSSYFQGKTAKSKKELEEILSQITKNSSLIPEIVDYPIEKLLEFKIFPYVSGLDDSLEDTYYIEIDFKNSYQIDIKVDSIQLCLVNSMAEKLYFSVDETILIPGSNRMKLKTFDLICGDFQLYQLKICLNKLNLTRFINDDYIIKYEKIAVYPSSSKTWCQFMNPSNMQLGSKAMLLKIFAGNSKIENGKIKITSFTKGVNIPPSQISISDSDGSVVRVIDSSNDQDSADFEVDSIEGRSVSNILIPYTINSNENVITFKATFTYNTGERLFSYTFEDSVDTTLTIAVSVQDIFKASNLFSKFSVGTSDSNFPIRILDANLTSDGNYNISSPAKPNSLIAFGEQPSSFFYKIKPSLEHKVRSTDTLNLEIMYRNLKEECIYTLAMLFAECLKEKGFQKYELLLNPIIKQLDFNLITYALKNIVSIKSFDILKYSEIFSHCSPTDRLELMSLVEELVHNSSTFEVGQKNINYGVIDRKLYISVPVPIVQVIHVARFNFTEQSQYIVGEPIEMMLNLKSVTTWRGEYDTNIPQTANSDISKGKKKVLFETTIEKIEQFSLELEGYEDWLISGKRKVRFDVDHTKSSKSCAEQIIELILVPLKVGRLSLPKLNIKAINNYLNDEFVMEIDYRNISQTILVVPELDRVTFAF